MTARFTAGRVPASGLEHVFDTAAQWQAWLDVEAALAQAQAELGIIPAEAGAAIADACRDDDLDLQRVHDEILRTSHPFMPLVVELNRVVGDPHGGWVHWGATTQNITQTGDVLLLVRAHDVITGRLRELIGALADLADRTADMTMAGRTHGQHAVPITFGLKAAGWIDEYLRHLERMTQLRPRLATALLGGAAGTSAGFGPHARRLQEDVARRLGLTAMPVPSRSIGDHFAELVTVLGLIAATSGRFGNEIYQLMKTEYGEAEEPMPPGTVGSSTMPHKRNPQLCQDIIGLSSELRALVPLALESAMSEHEADNRPTLAFDTAERACRLTADALVRVEIIAAGLHVDPRRMLDNLAISGGLMMSEAIMLALGARLGRQAAHDVVYTAAQASAAADGLTFAAALAADERVCAQLSETEIGDLLDPQRYVGQAPALARTQAARARRAVADDPEAVPE